MSGIVWIWFLPCYFAILEKCSSSGSPFAHRTLLAGIWEPHREWESEEKKRHRVRIVTTAGALVCHLSLRQPVREIRGGRGGETEKSRGGGRRGGGGFLEAQWSVDVALSSWEQRDREPIWGTRGSAERRMQKKHTKDGEMEGTAQEKREGGVLMWR